MKKSFTLALFSSLVLGCFAAETIYRGDSTDKKDVICYYQSGNFYRDAARKEVLYAHPGNMVAKEAPKASPDNSIFRLQGNRIYKGFSINQVRHVQGYGGETRNRRDYDHHRIQGAAGWEICAWRGALHHQRQQDISRCVNRCQGLPADIHRKLHQFPAVVHGCRINEIVCSILLKKPGLVQVKNQFPACYSVTWRQYGHETDPIGIELLAGCRLLSVRSGEPAAFDADGEI